MTEADQQKAREIAHAWVMGDCTVASMREMVAAALALERDVARAPFLAVLYQWTNSGDVTRMWLVKEFREAVERDD